MNKENIRSIPGKIGNFIRVFFTNNPGYKALALLIGIIMWALLSNANDPVVTKTVSVPVTYEYEDKLLSDEGLILVSAPDTVNLNVSCRQSNVSKITASLFYCTADLINHVGGDLSSQRVYISAVQIGGKDLVTDWSYSKNDPTVTVEMDEYITKTFTVELSAEDDLTDGLILDNSLAFEPSTVTVSGPKSEFASLSSVKAVVNMQELSEEGGGYFEKQITLGLYDANDNLLVSDDLTLSTDTVTLTATVKRITSAQVKLAGVTGEPAEGYRYVSAAITPSTITVSGLKSSVANLTEIVIPEDAVDITGITKDTAYTLDITPYLPDGVSFAGEDPTVSITVSVEALESKTVRISSSDISLLNRSGEYMYTLEETPVYLTVKGFAEDLELLKVSDLAPYVNVEGLGPGRHRVQVLINEVSGYTYVNSGELYTYITVAAENESSEAEETETQESQVPSSETEESESQSDTESSETTETPEGTAETDETEKNSDNTMENAAY